MIFFPIHGKLILNIDWTKAIICTQIRKVVFWWIENKYVVPYTITQRHGMSYFCVHNTPRIMGSGHLVPKTVRTQDNSCPGQLVPKASRNQDTSYPGYELSWVRDVLGTSCFGYELSWMRLVLGTWFWVRVFHNPRIIEVDQCREIRRLPESPCHYEEEPAYGNNPLPD